MKRVMALLAVSLSFCLFCSACLGQGRRETKLKTEFTALDKEYTKAETKFYELLKKAEEGGGSAKSAPDITKSPFHKYLPRYRSLEKRARGTETGARAISWIIAHGGEINASEGTLPLALLTHDYINSALLEEIAARLEYLVDVKIEVPQAEETLLTIVKRSPHRKVRACALFTLARALKMAQQNQDQLPDLKRALEDMRKNQKESPAAIKEYEGFLAMVERAKIPDGEVFRLFSQVRRDYAGTEYAKRANSDLYEIENLAIGKVAPDFEATDQEGKKFKLSDYRGKVVVVDFWGFW